MPLPEEIGKAYATYYTHASLTRTNPAQVGAPPAGALGLFYQRLKHSYLQARYGYPMGVPPGVASLLAKCFSLLPFRRNNLDTEIRFLAAVPNGRLLDVGCGSGQWLRFMRQLGWEVEGVDFDQSAVEAGRQQGMALRCGSLEQQLFSDEAFDTITMSHVIEHLSDPVATLKECLRLLRKGGRLVLVTPNGASLGHRFFKQDWRGLEPPRHLHIFTPPSLRLALAAAGFRQILSRPQIAPSVLYESFLLRRNRCARPAVETGCDPAARAQARLFGAVERLLVKLRPGLSDFILATATKDRG